MKIEINTYFNIGDEVYHITPDSSLGIILDIKYYVKTNTCSYLVTFGRLDSDMVWCTEEELTEEKNF